MSLIKKWKHFGRSMLFTEENSGGKINIFPMYDFFMRFVVRIK